MNKAKTLFARIIPNPEILLMEKWISYHKELVAKNPKGFIERDMEQDP